MSRLSDKAFAIMGVCEETKKLFGITVDPRNRGFSFVWAFKMNKDQAKREGYDKTSVKGAISYDSDFNGCPYCQSKSFYICAHCGKVVCYHGSEYVTCPNCGVSSSLSPSTEVELKGGGL